MITRKIVDTERVKLTLYHGLEDWKLRWGMHVLRHNLDRLVAERLIVEIHGFGRALELVIE